MCSGVIRPRALPRWKEGSMENEQPDWNFWCFVIALFELLTHAMTKL